MKRPILIVSGDFVKTGGMDRANYALADHLSRRGDEVHLVAYRADADLIARPNVTLHRVRRLLKSYSLSTPLLDHRGRDWAARLMPRGGRVIVNGGNCQWGDVNWVHHINLLDRPKSAGNLLRRFKTRLDHRRYVGAERSALGMARHLVTTCRKNRDDLIKHFGLAPEKIDVVYYGNDPEVFHPATPDERAELRAKLQWPADRPVYLFVGALGDRRKGFDTLFDAWSLLCQKPDWHAMLVVVGDGAERSAWEKRASGTGLSERIKFMGFRRDVPDLLRACDAHVLPSRYEGYSLVTQEALCCGLPAFVTKTAGIAERFEGPLAEALLIADPNDAPALADQLLAWHDRADSVKPLLAQFSERLRAYTWDDMAGLIANVISNGVAATPANRT
jgi:glycosyltransferase involved in cell wall biosynthesis